MAVIAFPVATRPGPAPRARSTGAARPGHPRPGNPRQGSLRVVREVEGSDGFLGAAPRVRTVTVLRGAPPAAASGARLVARRVVAALVLVGLAIALWSGLGAMQRLQDTSASTLVGAHRVAGGYAYTVRPGDTIWSIATAVDPSGDPRPIVDRLVAQLHSSVVYPGEHLVVPT